MRIPPIAVLFLAAVSSAPVGSILLAAAPASDAAVGVGADSTPGYYPTWQPTKNASNPHSEGVPSPDNSGVDRSGWATGGATLQYPSNQQTDTAELINPYLLRNVTTPEGGRTAGGRVDDFLSPLVPQSAVFHLNDRSTTTVDTNLGLYLQRDLDLEASQIKAGPLFVHFYQIDAIGLYDDLSGPFAAQEPSSDKFIGAVGLKFNIDLRLSPRTFLDVQGEAYYVFPKSKFGFYLHDSTASYAHLEHTVEIDRWDVTFFDYLDVITPLSSLLTYGSNQAAFDRSGLYTVGYLNSHVSNPFDSQQLYLRNTIGLKVSSYLQSDLRFTAGYEHYDLWETDSLNHLPSVDHLSAGLYYEPRDLWFLPWTTYDVYATGGFSGELNQWYVGATLPISRAIQAFVRAGWAWNSGDYGSGVNDGLFVWDVGVNHHIDDQWNESAVVGNSYRYSPLLVETHGLYATYSLNYASNSSSLFAGISATWGHEYPLASTSSVFTGYAGFRLDPRTSVRGTVIYAPSDFTQPGAGGGRGNTDVWLYRAELDRNLTPTLDLQFIYQVTDYHTTVLGGSYVDNLFMITLSKRL